MSNLYCGAKKVPKNSQLGTSYECLENGKISYYGLVSLSAKTISVVENIIKTDKKFNKITANITKCKLTIKSINTQLSYNNNEKQRIKLENKLEKIIDKKEELEEDLKEIKKDRNEIKTLYLKLIKKEEDIMKKQKQKTLSSFK